MFLQFENVTSLKIFILQKKFKILKKDQFGHGFDLQTLFQNFKVWLLIPNVRIDLGVMGLSLTLFYITFLTHFPCHALALTTSLKLGSWQLETNTKQYNDWKQKTKQPKGLWTWAKNTNA